jgi:hypothetical protein
MATLEGATIRHEAVAFRKPLRMALSAKAAALRPMSFTPAYTANTVTPGGGGALFGCGGRGGLGGGPGGGLGGGLGGLGGGGLVTYVDSVATTQPNGKPLTPLQDPSVLLRSAHSGSGSPKHELAPDMVHDALSA